jgi:hypothetical protein
MDNDKIGDLGKHTIEETIPNIDRNTKKSKQTRVYREITTTYV